MWNAETPLRRGRRSGREGWAHLTKSTPHLGSTVQARGRLRGDEACPTHDHCSQWPRGGHAPESGAALTLPVPRAVAHTAGPVQP